MTKKTSIRFLLLSLFLLLLYPISAQLPAGYYYPALGKTKDELKTALHQLAYPLRVLNYGSGEGSTWEGFFQTDQVSPDTVFDRYSSIIRYFDGFNGVSEMHIEHALPKSWWGGANNFAYRDLFHLYPSDGTTNSRKNNYPLGIVSEIPNYDNGVSKIGINVYGADYSGLSFEPADEFKGDFARSYFYVATIYEDLAPFWNSPMMNRNTYPVWTSWAAELLLEWHRQDPVSELEKNRQEAIFNIQKNRNPYIDYPNLVEYIWGPDTLRVYPFPQHMEAFIAFPRPGDVLDFEVILQGDSVTKSLLIKGVNLTADLTISTRNQNAVFVPAVQYISKESGLVGIDLNIRFSPPASGTYHDTLVIGGGDMMYDVLVPLVGKGSKEFMVLDAGERTPVSAQLKWIADPHATDYKLNLYKGADRAGNLIFSSYVEGSSYNKALELYNGTGKTLDLSDYLLQKQSNGEGVFEADFQLSGTLAAGETYLLVHRSSSDELLRPKADLLTDTIMNFNGNDALALLHHGILIDRVGFPDAGASLMWGENLSLKRKATVTHPSTHFNLSEWESYVADDFSMLDGHTMHFQTPLNYHLQSVSTNGNSFYLVHELMPETRYTYFVEAVKEGVSNPSVNTMQFTTQSLDAPVAMEAMDVSNTAFTANWEDDLWVNTFLLDVFELSGAADTTETEPFDMVGSTGKPLPEGWEGTASGYYTSTTSSGIAPPSISLKNTAEWLQTKSYPQPVTRLSFMYRFPSSGTGSYFIVEALADNQWQRIDSISFVNTAKYHPEYCFDSSEDVKAFRITYTLKVSGNLAFDDFSVSYGGQTATYLMRDLPITGTAYRVENLSPATEYHYRTRAVLGDKMSDYSETVSVTTQLNNSISKPTSSVRIISTPTGFQLEGLEGGEQISLYGLSGTLLQQTQARYSEVAFTHLPSGIYILSVQHPNYHYRTKIIR